MACVNVNSPEYKSLVKSLDRREQFVARAVISKYLTVNDTEALPDFIELKGLISDLYNTPNAGIEYRDFYNEVKAVFKNLIPSLSNKELDERIKFVDKLELMRLRNGKEVLTSFINNTVYVSTSLLKDRGTQAYTDIRHEVFHTIFNNFLSLKEQETLAESFKRWKPEFSSIQDKEALEEAMADSFESYRFNKNQSIFKVIKDFFDEILKFFGILNTGYVDIKKLFDDVEAGKFTRNYLNDSLVTRDKSIISIHPEFSTDLDLFLQAKAFMLNNLNELMFPENSKNLSERYNGGLFLKQDYDSAIFKNNKNLFKLGLTKENALAQLQVRLKALKNDKTIDPQLDKVVKVLSKSNIFKDMFDYLQPYSMAEVGNDGELTLKNQIQEDPTLTIIEDENQGGLEIGSKELINPTTKISEVVKDFLTAVSYETTPGNFVSIDPGAGFIALLNMLGSLYGNTSIEDNLQSVKDNYQNTTKGNQTKALYNKLLELHESVIGRDSMSLNIKGIKTEELDQLKNQFQEAGIKYEIKKDNLNLIIPENIKIENKGTNSTDNIVVFTFNRLKEGKQSFLKEQKPGESNKRFVEEIAQEVNLPSFVIAKLFKYNEDRNTIAELTKVANSLRKLSPKFVKVSTSRVEDPDGLGSANVTSFAFVNRVNEFKSSDSLSSSIREKLSNLSIRQAFIDSVKKYDKIKNSTDRVPQRSLLKDILINKLQVLGEDDFNKIANKDVSKLLNNLEKIVKFVPEIDTTIEVENIKDNKAFLRHTSNLGSSLVNYTYEKNTPTSFKTSTSNKSKWGNVMPNTAYKIFKNIQDFALQDKDKKIKPLPFLKNSFNNYLKYNPIINHNYTNGTFSVNEEMFKYNDEDFISDHQETYFENPSSNYEKPPIPFSKESPREWINRNFLVMFNVPIIESLTQNKKNKAVSLSYYQQKFQPESAPNVSVIKMGVSTAEQLKNNIASMIIQEAFMNHKFSTSTRGNLSENSKKSYLPGLEGSTYFLKDGKNIFFDDVGNINSSFGSVKNGNFVINTSNTVIKSLTKTILDSLDFSLKEFVDVAINEKATIEGTMLAEVYNKIQNSYLDNYKLSDEELSILKSIGIDARTDVEELKKEESFEQQKKVLGKAMSAYYLNSYVNGYFMNQMSSGAAQNYKNPLDEIKRQAGVNAMNDTGLIDNKHGMPNTYRNIVMASANDFYGKSHKLAGIDLLKRFFANKQNEVADAQSYDIPEYKTLLRKSFGKSVDIGVATKDVHFEINENGGTDYRKTSSIELTNELVKKNKTLKDLRFKLTFEPYINSLSDSEKEEKTARIRELYDNHVDSDGIKDVNAYMEYEDYLETAAPTMIHKASFESAIKGSKPSKPSQFVKNKESGTFDFQLEPSSVLNLNSSYNGIQQAIRHRYIDSFISHFTQLTYLTGLNRTPTSIKNNKIVTSTLSKFTKSGIFDTLFDYRMAYSEDKILKANLRSKKEFINDLKKNLDLPDNERLVALLNTFGISMNNPLFTEKLMQSFFNSLSKKTVMPKHPGGSFVLQSEFGLESNKILTENSLRIPELKIQDGKILYAECYLPEMYSDQLKNKDLIYYNNDEYNKMFGFRLPSSDLHSSVPLKVIGYYPSKAHDNVVVIPSAVTALHGSDFDVDKLFVVRQGVFGVSDEEKDPKAVDKTTDETSNNREFKTKFQANNKVIAQKGIKFGYTVPDAQYTEQGQIISFGDNKHVKVSNLEDILFDEKEKTQNKILALEDQQNALTPGKDRKESTLNGIEYRKFTDQIKSLTNHLKTLKSIQKGYYSNTILDSILDNISYSGENANDILFGITFDPVKGYKEASEYSQLARVFSKNNKKKGIDDLLSERPKTFKTLEEAFNRDQKVYNKIKQQLEENLGVDTSTKEGQEDLLSLINNKLENNWVADRDEFLRRQRGSGNVNINRVEQHVKVHKETYMASGLVGLIANFSKGLAYAFHAINNGTNAITLNMSEDDMVVIDGVKVDELVLENKDSIKNQELKSLALNAAIDHVKEQILNVLNVGNNTTKIFLAGLSTKLTLHQTTMLMLQPSAKELNSSNASTIAKTLGSLQEQILEKAGQEGVAISETDIQEYEITTEKLEPLIQTSFSEILNDTKNPKYKQGLIQQLKVLKQLDTLNNIGEEVSSISRNLGIIQSLPYNLEGAYDVLKSMNKFIDINKFFSKLKYAERSEYSEKGFKDDLKSSKTLFANVNLANNENVLGALEAIKMQIDVASEMFSENSVQMQFLINNILKAISNNSDPATMFTGENDQNVTFDTAKNMSIADKYLKGRNTYVITKLISKNIFNFLTSGLNIPYNDGNHLMSLGIQDQKLNVITKDSKNIYLGPIRSFLGQFLMKSKEISSSDGIYNGDDFLVSQINPAWRLKPLSLIKKQNKDSNKFLRNVGIDYNFRDKVNVMTFNSDLVNSAENLAEIEQAVNQLNGLNNIYVRKDSKGNWLDLPAESHPYTPEMSEIIFNILKASLYTDQFKFSSSKVTNVIPTKYFKNIFKNLDILTKGLIYYKKSAEGEKYYKDFSNSGNQSNEFSALADIKENLFINTIMSVPSILPNIAGKKNADGSPIWTSKTKPGILSNGNIYDLYIDAIVLDDAPQTDQEEVSTEEKTVDNSNIEIEADITEETAKADLANTFKKNPSFLVEQDFKDNSKYDLFMKVGSQGSKEEGNLRHFYKKIANINNKITNNSFDTNLLLNKYKIKDFYNPKRFAIPVKPDVDLTQDRIKLENITISSFLINAKPKNAKETDESHLKNLINQVKQVSLFDGRNLDRIGLKIFNIESFTISSDKSTISFDLQAIPRSEQVKMNKFYHPLNLEENKEKDSLSRDEKIAKINNTFGAKRFSQNQAQELTDAVLNEAYDEAVEISETKEINKVLKEKSKNCK